MKQVHYLQIFSLSLVNCVYLVREDGKPLYDSEIRENSRKKRQTKENQVIKMTEKIHIIGLENQFWSSF